MDSIEDNIARALSGESSSEDILALSDWLSESERHKAEFEMLQGYWDSQVVPVSTLDPADSLERLLTAVNIQNRKKWNKRLAYLVASAASVVGVVAVSLFFLLNASSETSCQYYTYITGDHKSSVTLEDGTEVILNRHSKLTYSNLFGVDKRTVQLDGEGFFDVTPDKNHPFEIEMGDSKITVLGTKFDVRTSAQYKSIVTTLVEGSIRFESPKQKVVISPNQQLKYNREKSSITIEAIDAEYETYWKDELFEYRSVALKDLIGELERRYDIEIVLPKNRELAAQQVSGAFSEKQDIEEILDVITRSIRLQWHKQNGIYYIHNQNRKPME